MNLRAKNPTQILADLCRLAHLRTLLPKTRPLRVKPRIGFPSAPAGACEVIPPGALAAAPILERQQQVVQLLVRPPLWHGRHLKPPRGRKGLGPRNCRSLDSLRRIGDKRILLDETIDFELRTAVSLRMKVPRPVEYEAWMLPTPQLVEPHLSRIVQ